MLTPLEKLEAFGQLQGEVSLYRLSQDHWRLMVGNPSKHVLLGEVDGIYQVNGDSILDVIEKMSELLSEL